MRNAITLNIPPFFVLPPVFIAECDIIWYGTSFWSVGVSCPSCVPSQLLVQPQPTRWWGGVRKKGLDAVQALLSSKHAFVINTLSTINPKHSPTQATSKKTNSVPVQTSITRKFKHNCKEESGTCPTSAV